MSYKCNGCRGSFDGEPLLENATGAYCQDCKAEFHARVEAGRLRRMAERRERCLWCGLSVAESERAAADSGLHQKCDDGRTWLLQCIRYSEHASNYVRKTEERERGQRNARKMRELEARASVVDGNAPETSLLPLGHARTSNISADMAEVIAKAVHAVMEKYIAADARQTTRAAGGK